MELTTAIQTLVIEALQSGYELERDAIKLETDLGDLGFDSLGLTAVVARAESEYGVEFSPEHILEMYQSMRVSDLAQAIEAGVAAHRAGNGG